ncbi:hypothetical protein [Allocoleopsis sp.]|uniref:hypothetical protein n=1 Tax=Allocoleopsis sp. TaxID=3088169 RepID=UPI002FCF551B
METATQNRSLQTKRISAKELHQYIWILIGVFTLVAATFPTALMRVSKDKKFAAYNFHLKSLTIEGQLPKPSSQSSDVQPVVAQPFARTASSGNTEKTLNISSASTTNQAAQARHPSNATAEITNTEQLAALNQKLHSQIEQVWQASRRRFDQALEYRISVREDGAITSYEAINSAASDYLQQTPLPKLFVPPTPNKTGTQAGGSIQESVGQFRVVFTSQGILEVSPWHGWGR